MVGENNRRKLQMREDITPEKINAEVCESYHNLSYLKDQEEAQANVEVERSEVKVGCLDNVADVKCSIY